MKVVYIIGPFRAKNHWEVMQNVLRAEMLGLVVARSGSMPLIPHKNTENFNGLLDDDFWLEGTKELLRRCDAAITVEAINYSCDDSAGSKGEIDEMIKLGRPVFRSLPGLLAWLKKEQQGESHG
jgi:hypothetical protein